jgi:glycosyltransferase involved in cell wall biosynthesis
MEHPLISIIIPIYNGEKYLRECIDSIVSQTWENWELLLIDDGSTDSSAAICDEYAKNDKRIIAVHKQNGGQASARNNGIAMAKGDYVTFVDADDWLEADTYEKMMAVIQSNSAEVVICGYIEEYSTRKKEVNNDGELKCFEAHEALKMLLEGKIGSYLWSMLFRRNVIQEFMPDLNPYEDHATIFKWISHSSRVVVWHHAFYHYRQLEGSSLHSYNPKNGNHFFLAIKERYHYIAERNLLPGWEKENRRLYLRGCIKLTKDLARMPDYDQQLRAIIVEVRNELSRFLPVSIQELGTKYYIRLRLLLLDVDIYVRILRFSAMFSIGKQLKDKGMIH